MIKERYHVLNVKRSIGCVYCDFKVWPDGPRGHFIDGRWIACLLQAPPTAQAEAVEERHRHAQRPMPSLPTRVTI